MEANDFYGRILRILESFLGSSYKGYNDAGQCQFDCPVCAEKTGKLEGDGKHNLEVSLSQLKFNCWVCGQSNGTRGTLSKLIKNFGDYGLLAEYKGILQEIKESRLYELRMTKDGILDEENETFCDDTEILLPNGFKPLSQNNSKDALLAKRYLYMRGITDKMISKFNIGYVGNVKDFRTRNRIIIPSHDIMSNVNYWVGRDYTGNSDKFHPKYINCNNDKKDIIFNEDFIMWDSDITLVEGPFDHICVPNSIPMLGKVLTKDFKLYNYLQEYAGASVNVFLDDDAREDAVRIVRELVQGKLENRVYIVPCPDGYDAALLFQTFGSKGIRDALRHRIKLSQIEIDRMYL